MRRHILALALVIPLSGCNTVAHVIGGNSIADSAPASVMQAEKALVLAFLAERGLGTVLIEAVNSGVLHGEAAAKAKHYYDTADSLLQIAKAADEAANADGIMAAISKAQDAMAQADALAHPKP